MCGIAGIISRDQIDPFHLQQMTDKLEHRGPDGEGFFLSAGINRSADMKGLINFSPELDFFSAFGHRRLSIVDLSSAGHQPMVLNDRYVITYNGEIYNHSELRGELESMGYCFVSHTDTEVILAAYDAWGVDCQKKFNGMWAFVIIDQYKKRIFISRDRFGVKPFYYYRNNNSFIFASEIKSIVSHPDVVTAPNIKHLKRYIKSGASVEGAETAFENVNRFPPASYIECALSDILGKELQFNIFWSVSVNNSNEVFSEKKAEDISNKYYLLLEDAVRLRLRADVKVGSALSGGLDSSSIVYLVNKILREKGLEEQQETFSCVYKTPGTESCDESIHINHLAHELSVRSNQVEPFLNDIPAAHQKMIYAMDCPPDSTCMSGWHTFLRVSQSDVTVTLDGQGADEQMAGYLGYVFLWFAQMPLLHAFIELKSVSRIPGALSKALPGLLVNLSRHIGGKNFTQMVLTKIGYKKNPFIPLNEVLLKDTQTHLLTLIHYSDRVSTAFSLESRMPFMDYRLVEFLASVPVAYKLHAGWTKYLARRAFSGKLPNDIVWRKDKMGWPIPEEFWFNGSLKKWLVDNVESSEFSKLIYGNTLQKKMNSASMPLTEKIRMLNISVWHDLFFNNKKYK